MPDQTMQQVQKVREALAQALGAADAALETARTRHVAAAERFERVKAAAERQRVTLAVERDKRLREIDHERHDQLRALAAAAADTAARSAPGAAGALWETWAPDWPTTAGPGPGLSAPSAGPGAGGRPELRVGRLRVPYDRDVPALIPLLDHGHVMVRGDAAQGDAVVAGLLLRTLGTTAPGTVRLTGYDPENLGGGLAGFAPLAPAGVLAFVGPGGLAKLLDELVDHVRRINETVLAGEHSSLRDLAAATGRRPEPWRVAVLLGGERSGELSRHEQDQLDRLLRTGAACGVHLMIHGLRVPAGPGVQIVDAAAGVQARLSRAGDLPVALDPGPPPALVTATCRQIAGAVAAGPAPVALDSLLPAREWRRARPPGSPRRWVTTRSARRSGSP